MYLLYNVYRFLHIHCLKTKVIHVYINGLYCITYTAQRNSNSLDIEIIDYLAIMQEIRTQNINILICILLSWLLYIISCLI